MSSNAASPHAARVRVLANIDQFGLHDAVRQLEVDGYTILPKALNDEQVDRAKQAILARVAQQTGNEVNPDSAGKSDFRGMQYRTDIASLKE